MKVPIAIFVGAGLLGTVIMVAHVSGRDASDQYEHGNQVVRLAIGFYLLGLEDAFGWANSHQIKSGVGPTYCPPEKLTLTVQDDVNILKQFITAHPETADYPTGLIFRHALQDRFPCPK
jgi:hypothetical protein